MSTITVEATQTDPLIQTCYNCGWYDWSYWWLVINCNGDPRGPIQWIKEIQTGDKLVRIEICANCGAEQ